jgi:hypothetical protein
MEMARTKKNQVGDWIAIPAIGVPGGRRPAKVLEVRQDEDGEDRVRVSLRFDNGQRDLWFDAPQPRIRWRRQNGRSRWEIQ